MILGASFSIVCYCLGFAFSINISKSICNLLILCCLKNFCFNVVTECTCFTNDQSGALLDVNCSTDDYLSPYSANHTHSTVSGIAAYRSALTLDWLDKSRRQRELTDEFGFGHGQPSLSKELDEDCLEYTRPAAGKIARLMLELMKNLEGDDGIIQELIKTLIRTKLLQSMSHLEVEPDLTALMQIPKLMQGKPHVTLPRILAVVWLLAVDPGSTKENGWCPIEQLTQYLDSASPVEIAVRMRTLDTIISGVRFVMEDFVKNVRPREVPLMEMKPRVTEGSHKKHIRHATGPPSNLSGYLLDFRMATQIELQSTTKKTEDVIVLTARKTYNPIAFSIAAHNTVCLYSLFCHVLFVVEL